MKVICEHNVDDILLSQQSGEIYLLTAIGKRKCLVEIVSEKGGSHEFERRIERVNKYIKIK